ncbi:MAG: hypothetical protein KF850_05635 [Labilithrix sp.]|nr:hypothetical protein [Labilithrix sp.]
MYTGSYGHRTYGFDDAERAYFGEISARPHTIAQPDEKSMNCLTPIMYAPRSARGRRLFPRRATRFQGAYGPDAWPWGATLAPVSDLPARSNFNNGVGSFSPANQQRFFRASTAGPFSADLRGDEAGAAQRERRALALRQEG